MQKNDKLNRPLFTVVKSGDLDSVKDLVESGSDVNVIDEYGDTPLHYATRNGYTDVVIFLIGKGANTNAIGRLGQTPLHYAMEHGNMEITKILVTHKADVNAQDGNGWTPLYLAMLGIVNSREDIIKFLIKNGAEVDAEGQHETAIIFHKNLYRYLNRDIAQLLIGKCNKVNITDNNGNTPLYYAIDSYSTDIAQLLIEKGAEINIKNKYGSTPLHLAAKKGDIDAVRLLVKHGADVNAKDSLGKTPLDYVTYDSCYSLLGAFVGITTALTYLFTVASMSMTAAISTLILAPVVGALIGHNIAKLEVNVDKEKIKDPDISTWTALTNVLIPECLSSKSAAV
ncbi:ankyrin repeat domain-containing protein [Wolbachia endosymbiont of Anurida maritima]|uniref:ankyrin repeat domain-containing protein n=1 Tax=Wolbachia endosymbiont of Anurida maritima TaxID=2850562 RepID=UPI0035D0536D